MRKIRTFLSREDFRANPLKALIKRFYWRMRWIAVASPIKVRYSFNTNLLMPKTGVAALIYYQGYSEPGVARFISDFLREGMVFVDIGAHIGEYTLLSSKIVKESGEVHAFEPNPDIALFLHRNIEENNVFNVKINQHAVSNVNDVVSFDIHKEPAYSSISIKSGWNKDVEIIKIHATTLDEYFKMGTRKVDLIKVDVEGAELLVFKGAETLISLPRDKAPVWIFEYHPQNYKKFEYSLEDLVQFVTSYHYRIFKMNHNVAGGFKLEEVGKSLDFEATNLIAMK